jgi:predicted dehydrogenase
LPAPADADIHDTISALIRYRGGATVSYLLSACSSWEGYELRMEGTTGTLSATYEAAPVTGRAPAPTFVAEFAPHDGPIERIELPRQPGNHSGADARMVAAIFRGETSNAENLRQAATALDGGYAVAVGEAVSRSAAAGVPVAIPDLGAVAPSPERHAVVGARAG